MLCGIPQHVSLWNSHAIDLPSHRTFTPVNQRHASASNVQQTFSYAYLEAVFALLEKTFLAVSEMHVQTIHSNSSEASPAHGGADSAEFLPLRRGEVQASSRVLLQECAAVGWIP